MIQHRKCGEEKLFDFRSNIKQELFRAASEIKKFCDVFRGEMRCLGEMIDFEQFMNFVAVE